MRFFIGDKEKKLVDRLHGGDSSAMQDFYALYAEYLASVAARYLDNDDDLKDVLQDSMVKMLTNIGQFQYRGQGSLQAWATRIVVNQSLSFLKSKRAAALVSLDVDVAGDIEADDPPIEHIPPDVIHQMVRELPTGYRTVFNLYVFENKSHQEIAQLLGIKRDSSASQLHRAKNMLAKKIEQYNKTNSTR